MCDVAGLCDTATVDITVNEVNDGPTATNDGDTVDEDSSVTVDVLAWLLFVMSDDAESAGQVAEIRRQLNNRPGLFLKRSPRRRPCRNQSLP